MVNKLHIITRSDNLEAWPKYAVVVDVLTNAVLNEIELTAFCGFKGIPMSKYSPTKQCEDCGGKFDLLEKNEISPSELGFMGETGEG